MSYVLALTGGIGSGKSFAAKLFAQLQVPIIDADRISKSLTQPESIAYHEIVAHFGNNILLDDKQINRSKLREIVFQEPKHRIWLEHCLHPRILDAIKHQIHSIKAPYCIVVIPLLAENFEQYQELIDHVVVVDLDDKTRFERLMKRDKQSLEALKKIIATQATSLQRAKIANTILDNSGTPEQLTHQVLKLHELFSKK